MFDNLRDFSDAPYENDPQNDSVQEAASPIGSVPASPVRRIKKSKKFLGMTAQQRFLITLMLFVIVGLLGALAMVAIGIMTPF